MKKQILILFFLFAFTGIQFLYAEKTETRSLPVFNGISLSAGVTVYLDQGNIQKVELSGDEDAVAKLITEVKDGNLIIRYPSNNFDIFSPFQSMDRRRVVMHVAMAQIDRLRLSGTGSIVAENLVETKALEVGISGTGNLKMGNLKTESVSSHLSGTGTFSVSGEQSAAEFKTSISGTGSVKALDFKADDAIISISGTGSCSITANKSLNARISGTGSVSYRGNPHVDSKVSGTGHVRSVK
jgi:hypothetical protein